MHNITDLKNQKLKDFLKTYRFFISLSEQEQQDYLAKMIPMTDEEQEKIYEYLAMKEEDVKIDILKGLYEKITELDKDIDRAVKKEEENVVKEEEEQEVKNLLGELDNN